MKKISLGCTAVKHTDLEALVDDEDFEELDQYSWHADWYPRTGRYCVSRKSTKKDGPVKTVKMHRQILGITEEDLVSHINCNGLDNRKVNLRIGTPSSSQGRRGPKEGCTSAYKGVCWHKGAGKWTSSIGIYRKRKSLGYYEDEKNAARAYDAAAKEHFGEFAYLNFPDEK